jgi:lysophospholipid acyltransferase
MNRISSAIGLPYDDFKIFFCIIVQIPLSFLYRKLPSATPQDQYIRKIYGVVVAVATNLYCFDILGLVVFFLSSLFSYFISLRSTTKSRAFRLSFVSFSFLCLANIIRLIVDYEGNSNNVSLLFMILTPRMIYFNWTVCRLHETGKQAEIPSLQNYLLYIFNFLGGLIGPVYSYEEWDHFIRQTFPEAAANLKEIAKASADIIGFFVIFFLGGKYLDQGLIESSKFGDFNILAQIGIITIDAILVRSRYIIGWRLESLQMILANLRDSESQFREHVQTINWREVELENSTKIRIDNWNISIQKWLKNCFYLPSQEALKFSAYQASLLTFVVSAFWHGFYPTYYFSFVAWNFVLEAEKMVYKCPALFAFFPSFFFRFMLDLHGLLFKRFVSRNWRAAFWNLKWFVLANFVVFGALKVVTPILNKKYGGRRKEGVKDGVLKEKGAAPAYAKAPRATQK